MNPNDPRRDVLALDRHDGRLSDGGLLGNLDYVDRAAGIVRVDTNDEALVERLAEAMWDWENHYYPGSKLDETYAEFAAKRTGVRVLRGMAKSAIAALREATR